MASKKIKKQHAPPVSKKTLLAQEKSDKERKNLLISLGVILVVAFIALSPALSNEFVNWDDEAYIVNNPVVHDLSADNIAHIFNIQTQVVGNYHPLTVLSMAIEYSMVGISPTLYHSDNLLLHLLNICLVSQLRARSRPI